MHRKNKSIQIIHDLKNGFINFSSLLELARHFPVQQKELGKELYHAFNEDHAFFQTLVSHLNDNELIALADFAPDVEDFKNHFFRLLSEMPALFARFSLDTLEEIFKKVDHQLSLELEKLSVTHPEIYKTVIADNIHDRSILKSISLRKLFTLFNDEPEFFKQVAVRSQWLCNYESDAHEYRNKLISYFTENPDVFIKEAPRFIFSNLKNRLKKALASKEHQEKENLLQLFLEDSVVFRAIVNNLRNINCICEFLDPLFTSFPECKEAFEKNLFNLFDDEPALLQTLFKGNPFLARWLASTFPKKMSFINERMQHFMDTDVEFFKSIAVTSSSANLTKLYATRRAALADKLCRLLTEDTEFQKRLLSNSHVMNSFDESYPNEYQQTVVHLLDKLFDENPEFFKAKALNDTYDFTNDRTAIENLIELYPKGKGAFADKLFEFFIQDPNFFFQMVGFHMHTIIVIANTYPTRREEFATMLFAMLENNAIYFNNPVSPNKTVENEYKITTLTELFPERDKEIKCLFEIYNNPISQVLASATQNGNYLLIKKVASLVENKKLNNVMDRHFRNYLMTFTTELLANHSQQNVTTITSDELLKTEQALKMLQTKLADISAPSLLNIATMFVTKWNLPTKELPIELDEYVINGVQPSLSETFKIR